MNMKTKDIKLCRIIYKCTQKLSLSNLLILSIYTFYLFVTFHFSETSAICSDTQTQLYSDSAIIRNNDYPSLGYSACSIRIHVPDAHFVTLTIHDIARKSTTPGCDGDIRLRTRRPCSGYGFPGQDFCVMHQNFTSFASCGDVDIRISPSAFGLRFLITYSSMYNYVAIFVENTQVQFNCYFCRIYRLNILNYTNI